MFLWGIPADLQRTDRDLYARAGGEKVFGDEDIKVGDLRGGATSRNGTFWSSRDKKITQSEDNYITLSPNNRT